jgi:integrase
MSRLINRLNSTAVRTTKEVGRHADGGGLYLSISENGGRRWTFLYRWKGKKTEIGLGSARDVPLATARDLAKAAREALATGANPKDAPRVAVRVDVPTFGDVAEQLITSMEPSWRNPKHAAQWHMTLMGRVRDGEGWKASEIDYCAALRPLPVNTVTTEHVLTVLQPIWTSKAETASRLRGRIQRVMAAAKAKKHFTGENPARWEDNLQELLSKRQKLTRGHHAAMPYADLPEFMVRLLARRALAARMLQLAILAATRTNEVLEAVWTEFELEAVPVTARDTKGREYTIMGPVWTVPAARMKALRIHQVPLSPDAVALLKDLQKVKRGPFVFPGFKAGKPLSNMAMENVLKRMGVFDATVHGMRSSFRDWASEETNFDSNTAEMALAHKVPDKVEAAYRRGTLFEKRRDLMTAWAAYLRPSA